MPQARTANNRGTDAGDQFLLGVSGTSAFVSFSSDGGWLRSTYPESEAMSVKLIVVDI